MERYYSPRLRRDLINPLYVEAKRQRIPMTELASQLVEAGLNRLRPDQPTIAEEPAEARAAQFGDRLMEVLNWW
jgi:hypothetical protein